MGEEIPLFGLEFNRSIRVESRPERLTSETGALLLREGLDRLGVIEWLASRLEDGRDPARIVHPMAELLRTSLVLLAQGWRDQDDADALRHDPALRLAVSERKGVSPLEARANEPDGLASQPTLSRLVTALSERDNRPALRESLLEISARHLAATRKGRLRQLTIDIDSLPVEVHGHQPGSEHNGHYHARVYHPLVARAAETGDLLDVRLRDGDAHTAEGGLEFISGLLDRVEGRMCQVAAVRIDAGFPEEKLLGALEERGTAYVARVRNNRKLDEMAAPYLRRPVGRPPNEPRMWLHEHTYQAKSWSRPRRVVLVVLEREGELFLHHFWLITNWTEAKMPASELLALYRQRGTAEGQLGELMNVLRPALSSSPRPKSHYRDEIPRSSTPWPDCRARNEVILVLNALAFNLMNAIRRAASHFLREPLSLGRLRERVLRVAGRFIVHARRIVLILSDSTAPLWHRTWAALFRWRAQPG
jgi:hypothetical protein